MCVYVWEEEGERSRGRGGGGGGGGGVCMVCVVRERSHCAGALCVRGRGWVLWCVSLCRCWLGDRGGGRGGGFDIQWCLARRAEM